ncbi:MAG: hypothetical protein QM785_10745 [Pyrinomonadaceae bacterium]
MINHVSIGVNNPEHVANVIAELWGGYAMPFPPSPGGFVVFEDDGRGTMIEIVPSDVHLVPGLGYPDEANFSKDTPTEDFEGTFVAGNERSLFGSVHVNINSPLDEATIKSIAKREGWRCFTANRGGGIFQLIEFWIEDRFMLEVNTPAMTEVYQQIATPENWAAFLEAPLPPKYASNYAGLVA